MNPFKSIFALPGTVRTLHREVRLIWQHYLKLSTAHNGVIDALSRMTEAIRRNEVSIAALRREVDFIRRRQYDPDATEPGRRH